MLILIEGPRGAGKSHLVDNYFAQNMRDDVIYFKWGFAGWVQSLNIDGDKIATHYFSLGNILTVLEMGNTLFKGKHLILDRSLFSTYVWALHRRRLHKSILMDELRLILQSPIYKNCHIFYVNKGQNVDIKRRYEKDIFDKYEDYSMEKFYYDEIFKQSHTLIDEDTNSITYFTNHFDKLSQAEFTNLINSLIDK